MSESEAGGYESECEDTNFAKETETAPSVQAVGSKEKCKESSNEEPLRKSARRRLEKQFDLVHLDRHENNQNKSDITFDMSSVSYWSDLMSDFAKGKIKDHDLGEQIRPMEILSGCSGYLSEGLSSQVLFL